jgi:hypothetical protein
MLKTKVNFISSMLQTGKGSWRNGKKKKKYIDKTEMLRKERGL